jgi:Protein of unknown function (DUF3800)
MAIDTKELGSMDGRVILNFDESGNMGKRGRYFTIACVESQQTKPLINVMSKAALKTKRTFSAFKNSDEIKAADAYPCIKDYFLRKISSKELSIRYIVADLLHVKKELTDDENLLYNFLLKFLIVPIAKRPDVTHLIINLDKRSIKVKSTNSFQDYIKLQLNYEYNCNVKVDVHYVESQNSFCIQAADYVANAINSYYEYQNNSYYNLIKEKVVQRELFPRRVFGQEKVVNIGV